MTVQIKSISKADFEQVEKIELTELQRSIHPPFFRPHSAIARHFLKLDGEQHNYLPFAVYYGEAVVGFFMIILDPSKTEVVWLSDLMIDHRYQRQGIGTAVIDLVIKWAHEHTAAKKIRLFCEKENVAARQFYEKAGFINRVASTGIFTKTIDLKPPPQSAGA